MSADAARAQPRDPSRLAPEYVRRDRPLHPGQADRELAREFGLDPRAIVKLASNENPRGPEPAVRAAIARRDRRARALSRRQRLRAEGGAGARATASAPTQIVLGNGSNDVLELVDAGVPAAGRRRGVLAACVRRLSAGDAGARRARHRGAGADFGHDLAGDARARSTPTTRVVFVANPNNPTGTWLAAGRGARRSSRRCRTTCWSCSTRPTTNTCAPEQRAPSAALARASIRTWSSRARSRRPTGSPALRVGYGSCIAQVADMLNRVRQPFNVNALAQAAALAALADDGVRRTKAARSTARACAQLEEGFARARPRLHPVARNFVAGAASATPARVYQRLLRAGRHRAPGRRLRRCPSTCASPSDCRRRTRASSPRSSARLPADAHGRPHDAAPRASTSSSSSASA